MKTNENLTSKLVSEYWDEAKTKLWQQYHVDPFGREQGECKWWYPKGQIGGIGNLKDVDWHGKYQQWWANGRRWFIDTNHFKKREHGTKIRFTYIKENQSFMQKLKIFSKKMKHLFFNLR